MLGTCAESPKCRGVETVSTLGRGVKRPEVCAKREASHRLISPTKQLAS